MCRRRGRVNSVDDEEQEISDEEERVEVFGILQLPGQQRRTRKTPPLTVDVSVQGTEIRTEVDTGASSTVISEEEWNRLRSKPRLEASNRRLVTYTGEALQVRGVAMVEVKFKNQVETLPLKVVKGTGPSLLGRDWLLVIQLDWKEMVGKLGVAEKNGDKLTTILHKHSEVFSQSLGHMPIKAHLRLKEGARPVRKKARPGPHALYPLVDQELERWIKEGVAEPVETDNSSG